MLCLLHLYKYAQCGKSDGGTVWWQCSTSRHGVRDAPAWTPLPLASWLLLEYKTKAHKLHRGTERYFYVTNREMFVYTDNTVTDCLYQDLSHSTFLRAIYTAAGLIITAPANRVCYVHGYTYLEWESNSVPKLLDKIQFPGLLYTCRVTIWLLHSLILHLEDGGN